MWKLWKWYSTSDKEECEVGILVIAIACVARVHILLVFLLLGATSGHHLIAVRFGSSASSCSKAFYLALLCGTEREVRRRMARLMASFFTRTQISS